ncbi:LysR family transcriptional regulator [Vibrio barjaei]|uniref:LysR family transcriptional regulator n=1 Tax=Vibrio barjaei TaxID=1676683 RepID=UPI0007BC7023|nr:LysR family transcriptional regulator [Vibrio barjaei]OIN26984.1 hypothetical protein AWH66_2001160 [Vibrio barjaei]
MQLNFRQLEIFEKVATTGSFSAAARKLGVAQSSVSLAISNLETDCGKVLFKRGARSVTLTSVGESLLSEARLILCRAENFHRIADSYGPQLESRYRIAIDPFYDMPRQFQLIQHLKKQYPELQLDILEGTAKEVTQWVLTSEADIGFSLGSMSALPELISHTMPSVPYAYLASPEHPLSALEQVTLQDLKMHRQVIVETSRDSGRNATAVKVCHCSSYNSAIIMVKSSYCWAYMPLGLNVMHEDIDDGQLIALEVFDSPQKHCQPQVFWRADHLDGEVHRAIQTWLLQNQ